MGERKVGGDKPVEKEKQGKEGGEKNGDWRGNGGGGGGGNKRGGRKSGGLRRGENVFQRCHPFIFAASHTRYLLKMANRHVKTQRM